MHCKLIFRSNWLYNIMTSIIFMLILWSAYFAYSYVKPVLNRDNGNPVDRCSSDFGPRQRSSTLFHRGVDITRGPTDGYGYGLGDKIRNIYQQYMAIHNLEYTDGGFGNFLTTTDSASPPMYMRYCHMPNNYPNSTDPNRWVCLYNATLDGTPTVRADLIVQYQNGSINKVWGSINEVPAGRQYQGVYVSTVLLSEEVFGRVGNKGESEGPHLHVMFTRQTNAAPSSVFPPFYYIPRTGTTNPTLTLYSWEPSPRVLVETKYGFNLTSRGSDTLETDLDFESANLAVSQNIGGPWTIKDNGFQVRNLRYDPYNGVFRDGSDKDPMIPRVVNGDSNGYDRFYLYWTPASNEGGRYWYMRIQTFRANGNILKEVVTQVYVST